MTNDEREIRELIDTWMKASMAGDHETVLGLMTDDVVFMVPGQEPFGKEAFQKASQEMSSVRYEGKSDIRELKIIGEYAYLRSYLEVTATVQNEGQERSAPVKKSGYTLTILKKDSDGAWRLIRDANLLTETSQA